MIRAKWAKPGYGLVELLERIGNRDVITNSEDTTYFSEGTILAVKWENERHPVTGLRQGRLVDARVATRQR